MKIDVKNIKAAYRTATESERTLLFTLFPDLHLGEEEKDNRPVTERIKTFEDACNELGNEHPFVRTWNSMYQGCEDGLDKCKDIADVLAYHKLRIITAALNEGWKPQFTKNERRWYPLLRLYNHDEMLEMSDEWKQKHTSIYDRDCYKGEYDGLSTTYTSNSPSIASSSFAPHLCYRNTALADYSGKQFIDLWADFYLIRK